jgi:CRISPR-associated endonuclease/helicase Cas3
MVQLVTGVGHFGFPDELAIGARGWIDVDHGDGVGTTVVDGIDPELVHHLIASHHGTARPLFPALVDADPQAISATARAPGDGSDVEIQIPGRRRQLDWNHPARFQSLCKRYGWWGLALLEAIVRLADMLASERGVEGAQEREPAEAAGTAG